ncbi:PIN domain-containing protein [Leifsonia naganoensis]|uniref:Putative nucleic acid-binding protein n=1 Tax=Leifsonia naganoensis TaxID=150025 RepID=A0A853DTP2_9MICO|nr:putative nucleic acid-binding protein [Leifsonia naganoensis]
MPFRVFVDANVLVPGRWRDIVLTLAEADLFEILWSPLVLEEVDRHLPAGMDAEARAFLFGAMNGAFPEALVEWPGAVDIDVRLDVNEKDRHVVAAALWGHADVLLTEDENLHNEVNRSHLLDAQRLPVFLTYAIDVSPTEAVAALIDMARRRWLRDPNATDSEVLERLRDYFGRHGWPTGLLGP